MKKLIVYCLLFVLVASLVTAGAVNQAIESEKTSRSSPAKVGQEVISSVAAPAGHMFYALPLITRRH